MACNPARTGDMCNLEIDYSTIIGDRILPFAITLDLANSVLIPATGQNQKFCYDVEAVGADDSRFADLSHLVLGICDQIPEDQIKNITVIINRVQQNVDFGEGGNVAVKTSEHPDPPTGCAGLKFDFPLNKVTGTMKFCFELTVPRLVDGIDLCLFGGGVTAQGLEICGTTCEEQGGCPVVGYHRSTVCVPVTVAPFATV